MRQLEEVVQALTSQVGDVSIVDVPPNERASLELLLEESFEGWYLRHAKKTLFEPGVVRKAVIEGCPAGLVMLRVLDGPVGYVFYIAVARAYRRRKVGTTLLQDSLDYFQSLGATEAYAAAEDDNVESTGLFKSKGFVRTGYGELSRKYGRFRALMMYRSMLVVPGEMLMCRVLTGGADRGTKDVEQPE